MQSKLCSHEDQRFAVEKLTLVNGNPAIKISASGREKLLVYRATYDEARDDDFSHINGEIAQRLIQQLGPDLSLLRQIRIPNI